MIPKNIAAVAGIVCILLASIACDEPTKQAQKILMDQGVILLQPARDYVKPGGLVVLPSHGRPSYLDPYDDMGSQPGNYVDFKAIVMGQTKNQVTGLGVALSAIGKLLPMPVALTYSGQQQITLSQITSGGQRLLTPMVSALIKRNATAGALHGQIAQNNRVFVVQEVYTAKALSLTTADKTELQVSYSSAGSLRECTLPSANASTGSGNAPEQKASTSADATTNQNKGAPVGTTPAKGNAITSTPNPASLGVAVGFCRAGSATLTLHSENSFPFAVRLNEIVSTPGGLDIKYGSFKFPGTLGDSDVERATAVISNTNSVLNELTHAQH
jgi:hypothetical protein